MQTLTLSACTLMTVTVNAKRRRQSGESQIPVSGHLPVAVAPHPGQHRNGSFFYSEQMTFYADAGMLGAVVGEKP